MDAAEAVTGAGLETLEQLVAKSLLVRGRRGDGATRLSMLATIRAYATERLAADADAERVRERHYDWFLATARRHGQDPALKGTDGAEHLARLAAENDDLAAASNGRSGGATPNARSQWSAPSAGSHSCRDRYAEAELDRPDAEPAGRRCPPALLAPVVRTKAKSLWALGRGAEQPAVLAALEDIGRRLDDPVILSQALQKPRQLRDQRRAARCGQRPRRRGASLGQDRRRRLGDRQGVAREGDRGTPSRSCASASMPLPRGSATSATSISSRTC